MSKKRMSAPKLSERELDNLRECLTESGRMVGVTPNVTSPTFSRRRRFSTAELRARGQRRADVQEGTMTLVIDGDGVLRWHPGSAVQVSTQPRSSQNARRASRAFRRGLPFSGEVVEQFTFDRLGLSDVNRYLSDWDERLTPQQGLLIWNAGQLQPISTLTGRKPNRTLLLVHGTFSNCQNLSSQLASVVGDESKSFLDWASTTYDLILAYNHPTLSVSPLLNALRLETVLEDVPGTIDVVCHSRGGLVARWWYELACSRPQRLGKVVFVGSPLAGTSLAAPDKIRAAIDYLTNLGQVIGTAAAAGSTLIPFFSVAQGLMSLVCSATGVLSKTPVADVFIALVPGLAAQSRIENNFEMVELRRRSRAMESYYAVMSDFQPTDPGWCFWRHFTKQRIAARAASLIFPRPHDLVVDHEAMNELGQGISIHDLKTGKLPQRLLNLGKNSTVHHVNYFQDPKVIRFLQQSLA